MKKEKKSQEPIVAIFFTNFSAGTDDKPPEIKEKVCTNWILLETSPWEVKTFEACHWIYLIYCRSIGKTSRERDLSEREKAAVIDPIQCTVLLLTWALQSLPGPSLSLSLSRHCALGAELQTPYFCHVEAGWDKILRQGPAEMAMSNCKARR